MGYPYFNPPWLQKINKIEEGNFFVASAGVEPDSVLDDIEAQRTRLIRTFKIVAVAVGAVGMILISFVIGM